MRHASPAVTAAVVALMSVTSVAKTVKVSDYGFDPLDSTAFIQRALDSKASTVIIDRQPTDWVSGPLFLTNANQEVVLEKGVTVRAKRGEFKALCPVFFFIYKTSGVTLRGEADARIVMNKQDYADPKQYRHSEWRHAVAVLASKDVVVRNLTILSSGGDGLDINGKNVVLENLVCHNHYRQGVSLGDVDGLVVRNCSFDGTYGTAPQCGTDLEPDSANQVLKDILFENCSFNGNWASGIDLHLACLTDKSEPVSITFRNCTSVGNRQYGITVFAGYLKRSVCGTLLFEKCRVAANGDHAVRLVNNMTNGLAIAFRDCDFDARGSSPAHAILFDNSQFQQDFAGVTFENCRLTLDAGKKVCTFAGMTGAGLRDVTGVLNVRRGEKSLACDLASFVAKHPPHPELMHDFSARSVDFRKLVPAGGTIDKPVTTPWLYRRATCLQHTPSAGNYEITFDTFTYDKNAPRPKVLLRDRWGTDLGSFTIDGDHFVYVLKANGENIYRLEMEIGNNHRVKMTSNLPGGFVCEDYQRLYGFPGGSPHEAYFSVPASAKSVAVEILALQKVDAVLYDARGEAVAAFADKTGRDVFSVPRKTTSQDEIWRLSFRKVEENCGYRIGGDALSVVSTSREAVLKEKR